ncbi:MAG: UDP-N-acetylmuramoyl-L-alanine--D-glutamate ligase [Planctomycetota bacterium]|nr:UDP-N-acetylmuramoyl-L-alanine--D-glutamate ligase [Planctomycetota bacterium]
MKGGLNILDSQVTVMGLGLFGGGSAVARHLAEAGARVTVTDLRSANVLAPAMEELADLDLEWHLGGHRQEDFTAADLVVANPAVPPDSPFLQAARGAGVPITSELALFLAACPGTLALITGTQGKSSTCQFLAGLLRAAPPSGAIHLGGNIGRSLLGELPQMSAADLAVLEVSSYQLAALSTEEREATRDRGRVAAVAITNILEDHLERHGSREAYAAAKTKILDLLRPGGTALLPARDGRLCTAAHGARGNSPQGQSKPDTIVGHRQTIPFGRGRAAERFPDLRLADGRIYCGDTLLGDAGDLRVAGAFQADNLLVAAGLARVLSMTPETIAQAIPTLRGLPHRMELLELLESGPRPIDASSTGDAIPAGGPVFIDNGVSTTPDSTLSALRSCRPPVVLVCGGRDKGLSFVELIAAARGPVRLVICFGEAAASMAARFREGGLEAEVHGELTAAARAACTAVGPGDTLLFSPACSSFDTFNNFRERALAFREALTPSARAPTPGGAG